ncbi:MAG: outer membrane beta-barrel protein [Bacteroidota bacterium]
MKKIILLFVTFFLVGSAFAQNKAYVSLGAGVGIGTARTYDLYQNETKVYPVGLGKGLNINLRAGYFLNKFMAIELGVAYRLGFNTTVTLSESSGSKSSGSTGNNKFSGNMLQLVPALVISPDLETGKLKPYARIGVIVGIMPSLVTKIDVTSSFSAHTVATLKYSGGVAIGGSAAIGCDFNLSDLLAIYAEIYYDALSFAPSKGKFTSFKVNDKDVLPDMTTSQKEVKFVTDLTGYKPSDSEPSQEFKNSYPFNSLGLNIGVKIKL